MIGTTIALLLAMGVTCDQTRVGQNLAEADRAFEAGNYSGALEAAQAVIDLDHTDARGYERLGMTHLRLGNRDAALDSFSRAIVIARMDEKLRILRAIGEILPMTFDITRSRKTWTGFIGSNPHGLTKLVVGNDGIIIQGNGSSFTLPCSHIGSRRAGWLELYDHDGRRFRLQHARGDSGVEARAAVVIDSVCPPELVGTPLLSDPIVAKRDPRLRRTFVRRAEGVNGFERFRVD